MKRENNRSSWELVYEQFKPAQEGLREALCTLGNGYFGTRGAAPECVASRVHYPGTYLAGVYNKLATNIAGRTVFNEDLVNCPNWLFLTFRIGRSAWVDPSIEKILSYRQQLDMQTGILNRKIRLRSRWGQTTIIETERIVHMADPHRAVLRYVIIPENYEGWITIKSGLDGTVQNTGVARYRQLNSRHLRPHSLGSFGRSSSYLCVKTSQSGVKISQAAKVHIFSQGKQLKPVSKILTKQNKAIYQEFKIFVRKQRRYEIEKIVSIYTSRDKDVRDSLSAAISSAKSSPGFNALLKTHKRAWSALWKEFDIRVEGDAFVQKILRLHTFHLLQSASIHNTKIDAGFPVRGLHGEAYRGHIFWDRLFATSFFDLHAPEISKALFLYRYRRLAQARKYARENWYRGAMFPWQSGSTGEEETQVVHLNPISGKWGPDYSCNQRHISFAIVYNVWQYWCRSGDLDFLARYGAEILLSIARFGAGLAQYNSKDGRYHTEGIMGPDEFHERFPGAPRPGFRDNAYTNLLIVWTLLRARETLAILPQKHKARILKKLGLNQRELTRWEYITRKMNLIVNADGIISQFDGYFSLKELDWPAYRAKYGKIHRIERILKAEGKSPNEYKVAKQADVLMIFYLFPLNEISDLLRRLGYKFDKDILKKNYQYYIKRTSHGSTLSKVVHCYLAHLLGKSQEAWDWFLKVLKSDIYDTQGGTTPEGIHTGVMGGSIDITFRGFAGINLVDDRIRIEPRLPKHWSSVRLSLRYRKSRFFICITKSQIIILRHGPKSKTIRIPVEVSGRLYYLRPGKTYKIALKKRR